MNVKNYTTKIEIKSAMIWNILFIIMLLGLFILAFTGKISGEQLIAFCSGLMTGIFSQMNPKQPNPTDQNFPMQDVE